MNFIFLSVILIALGIGLIIAIYKYQHLRTKFDALMKLETELIEVNNDLLTYAENQSLLHEKEKEIWLERIEYYRSLTEEGK